MSDISFLKNFITEYLFINTEELIPNKNKKNKKTNLSDVIFFFLRNKIMKNVIIVKINGIKKLYNIILRRCFLSNQIILSTNVK